MTRLLYFIPVIIGTLAFVGGSMMAATGLVLFIGSNLFPNLAEFRVQDLAASLAVGATLVLIGWMLLRLLTRKPVNHLKIGGDRISRELDARHD